MSLPSSNPFFVVILFVAVIAAVIFFGSRHSAELHRAPTTDTAAAGTLPR